MENELARADEVRLDDKGKQSLRAKLEHLYNLKSSMLCQMARTNWQLYGEKNTKFFHRAIQIRKRSNQIYGLEINNRWLTDPISIKASVFNHFKSFLGQNSLSKVFDLNSGFFQALTIDSSAKLSVMTRILKNIFINIINDFLKKEKNKI